MKPWYKSKTIWFNVATAIVATGNEMMPVLGVLDSATAETVRPFLVIGLAVGNTMLRVVTETKVTLR